MDKTPVAPVPPQGPYSSPPPMRITGQDGAIVLQEPPCREAVETHYQGSDALTIARGHATARRPGRMEASSEGDTCL